MKFRISLEKHPEYVLCISENRIRENFASIYLGI